MKESHTRSILKACTWRIIATGTTLVISYAVTGKTSVAITIAGVESVTKMFIYYFHERAWQSISRQTVRRLFGQHAPAISESYRTRLGAEQPIGGL